MEVRISIKQCDSSMNRKQQQTKRNKPFRVKRVRLQLSRAAVQNAMAKVSHGLRVARRGIGFARMG